jgi:hypothetical protein
MRETYSGSRAASTSLLIFGFLALCLGSSPPRASEILASLAPDASEDWVGASVLTDVDDPVALQDLYDFGELGVPPGFPGSAPVDPAYQRELDLAVTASRAHARAAALSVSFPPTAPSVHRGTTR